MNIINSEYTLDENAQISFGKVYRHFKGGLYVPILDAIDTVDGTTVIVYKRKGDNQFFTRPLQEFIGLVDKSKYPTVTQEFRFELHKESPML